MCMKKYLVVWFVDMWFVLDDEAEEDESGDLCGLVSSRRTTAPKQTLASDIATMTVATSRTFVKITNYPSRGSAVQTL